MHPAERPDDAALEQIEALLSDGAFEDALELLGEIAGPRSFGDCPAPIPHLAAMTLLLGGSPADAEVVTTGALAHDATDAGLLALRSEARFDQWNVDGAAADARAALAADPDVPQAHRVLGVLADLAGDRATADRHHAAAHAADPECFPAGVTCTLAQFDAVVQGALAELRADPVLAEVLETTAVVVEDMPGADVRGQPETTPDILGLFVGVPVGERGEGVEPVADTLYLYRCNIARGCGNAQELAEEIRTTVLHELGHLLGFEEEGLEEMGLE